MFVRILFLLLLALNIGAASWLFLAAKREPAAPPATDPGAPTLQLLAERDAANAHTELDSVPESEADLANDVCRTIGPLSTRADARAIANALRPLVKRSRTRETQQSQTRGYWVYLAAAPSREAALANARALADKNVRDYYVITAGDQQNMVSLGLFRDQGNAERRRAELAALGFAPRIDQRSENLPQYWIDFALSGENLPADFAARVPMPAGAGIAPSACF